MKPLKAAALVTVALITTSIVSCGPVTIRQPVLQATYNKAAGTHIIDLGFAKTVTPGKITVKLNRPAGFTAKVSYNGAGPKSSQDVQSYEIYLVKNAAAPPFTPGGDPLNAGAVVAGPFTINTDARITDTVEFINISNSFNDFYYAAVRAFSGPNLTGTQLIEKDNGALNPWAGTTANPPYFGHVAVSTTAVQIDNNNKIGPTNNVLTVFPKFLSATGTKVETGITFTGPFSLVKSYKVDIALDPTQPLFSRESAFAGPYAMNIQPPYQLTKNRENIFINNMPVGGPFYATIQAFSGPNGTGVNLTSQNNGLNPYNGVDNGARVAASDVGVTVDSSQGLSFTDPNFNFLDVTLDIEQNLINTIAGTGNPCAPSTDTCGDNGDAASATLAAPLGSMDFDSSGNIYFADSNSLRVRKIDISTGTITTVAGDGNSCASTALCGDGGPAVSANLTAPGGVAVAPNGDVYIADTFNHRIRKVIKAGGTIVTVAGTGTQGFSGEGTPAISANLNTPYGIDIDNSGNIFIADRDNHVIRKFTDGGNIVTVAGNGTQQGYAGDGLQANDPSVRLSFPYSVAVDNTTGNIFIADSGNNLIRMINISGIITRVAGASAPLPPSNSGFFGDGGPALSAKMAVPRGMAVAKNGDVYIADTNNNVIRKFTVGGNIDTVAGGSPIICSPSTNPCGDLGQATDASLRFPQGVAVDALGNIYITDTDNQKIRKVFVKD
jgi:hypothetical protein